MLTVLPQGPDGTVLWGRGRTQSVAGLIQIAGAAHAGPVPPARGSRSPASEAPPASAPGVALADPRIPECGLGLGTGPAPPL